ncbi:MAG: protein-glutamate O-methyltransferase CheR [Firmicutes bacterium]|nr:protein-glutamate O-methyltransferase CheR [Bacillota bacterium]
MLKIEEKDFLTLSKFVHANFGIDLSKKKQLIESRLTSTINGMGMEGFSQYVKYITTTTNKTDIEKMLNKLTTNYTYFMREKEHFDYFSKTILPYLVSTKKNKVLSIWSAGCSSGEEPYTLSILIKDFLGSSGSAWDTRVLATDISQNVLSTAMKGEYPLESIKNVPPNWKNQYFKTIPGTSKVAVAPAIKNNVIFRTFNLMDPIRFKIPFDVIFCRNVMIYFDQPTKDALVERFYNATNPGGYLLIGHSESINRGASKYQYLMPATYRKPLNQK